jgi:membrane protease YdiL (CAAX protease family)
MKLREDIPEPDLMDSASSRPEPSARKLAGGAIALCILLIVFWFIARFFHLKQLADHPVSTFAAFVLLFAPYWLFGFGAAAWLRRALPGGVERVAAAALLTLPYFVIAIPSHDFRWTVAAVLIALAVLSAAALETSPKPGTIADVIVLATAGLVIDLGLLNTHGPLARHGMIWPAGLGGFPKMMMANVALYCYLVIKPIEGVGYDLTPRLSDLKTGFREMLFYAPIVIPIGLLLGFLHFHSSWPQLWMPPAAWIFTFIFVALPEELFFRGLVQNLLERRFQGIGKTGGFGGKLGSLNGRNLALLLASILFGLSHFNKGGLFNWRYVLLATIAGIFYGRAWREKRRLFASSVTHASVDTLWSLWFR